METKSDSGYALLLFPFLNGYNLLQYLNQKGGTLPEREVIEIGISILRGIADLSRYGILHQDIKPENIIRTSDGNIKILDFGSARFQKSFFRGSTRTNRLHSAPEQILASKPTNLEALRLTSDERSDVYSAASVLYMLASGHLPFEKNKEKLLGQSPKSIDNSDVTEGLKRILNRLLSYHPRFRPHATQAISFLENGDVQPPIVNRGGFFYNASTTLKRLKDVAGNDDHLFDGIIADASKLPSSDLDYLRNGPLTTLIDPQTYLFQAPKLINTKYKKLPYYELGVSETNTGIEYITDKDSLINKVFDFEISAGADVLLPPYFLIKEFNDISWTLDGEITNRAIVLYKQCHLQMPLFKGVALAENILLSDTTRGRIIDYLTTTDWLTDVAGYYVLLEAHSDGLPSEAWLKAAKDLFTGLLSTGKAVIWGHAYLPATIFAYSGIGLGMGEGMAQRSFSLNEEASSIKISSPHLYIPKLFARIKWPSGPRALLAHSYSRFNEIICTEPCCNGVNFNSPMTRNPKNLALHIMRHLAKQYQKYSSPGGVAKAKNDLNLALQMYAEFRTNPNELFRIAIRNEIKPNTGAFLENWLNAFHSG